MAQNLGTSQDKKNIMTQNTKEIFKDVEIHTLICNKDLLLAINNFKSLQKFEEFDDVNVFLHDDGSLTESDIETLSVIKNVNVIRRVDADKLIVDYIKDYENCLEYRLGSNKINLWHKIKLFDYFYFSKTKKVLGVDTDLLFLRKPENLIENIINNIPFYFPDVQSAYCFNEPKTEIPVFEKVNTGLIYIPSEEHYDINHIENALKNLIRNGVNYFPSWIEQSAFAHMFLKIGSYVSLEENKHRIPYFQPVDINIVECLHFVSYPAVRETYKTYIEYLELDGGELVYENKHEVEYNENIIPLEYQIKKNNGVFVINYYWGLEKTKQQFLDHIFKIHTDNEIIERKLQSEKNGFFIFTTKSEKIKIEHTYDWFGDKKWADLGEIEIN